MYVKVENGVITGDPVKRPKLSLAYLGIPPLTKYLAEGWYPVVNNTYPNFNSEIHEYGAVSYVIQGQEVLKSFEILDKDLSVVKDAFLKEIDDACGFARQKYITTTPGQELVYADKMQQAQECLLDETRTVEKYPLVAAGIGVNDGVIDLLTAANEIITIATSWRGVAGTIENLRLSTKKNISDSLNVKEALVLIEEFRNAPL